MEEEAGERRPRLLSVIGTYLKPEMHTIYRQVKRVRSFEHLVVAERLVNEDRFPAERLEVLEKVRWPRKRKRPKRPKKPRCLGGESEGGGNFVRRFWWKHVRKQWPPPAGRWRLFGVLENCRARLGYGRRVRRYRRQVAAWREVARRGREERRRLKGRGLGWGGRPSAANGYRSCYDLGGAIERFRPDVVHVYFGNKATTFVEQLVRSGVPWVVSFHGADIAAGLDCPVYAERFRRMLGAATLVGARSRRLLGQLEAMGVPRERLRLSQTVIPMDEIPFFERDVPDDGRWVIVQACRLLEKKGLRTALRGFARVAGRWPGARFVICGEGPLEDALRRLAAELGVGERVEFAGLLEHDALFGLYGGAHVFLHPSETPPSGDQEGVPNALLEAMATGMPFVTTRHGGIPEVIEDGVGGHLVDERAPEQVGDALERLFGDAAHYRRCARVVREHVGARFAVGEGVRQLEAIYLEAMVLGGWQPEGGAPV